MNAVKHGERSAEAVAGRRRVVALMRMARSADEAVCELMRREALAIDGWDPTNTCDR